MTDPTRPLPKRLAVIRAIQELLATIKTAEGDAFDMDTNKVLRSVVLIGSEHRPNPAILSVLEAPRPDIAFFADDGQGRADNWTLLIQGLTQDDKTANTKDDAYFLLQDVERRLARISALKDGGRAAYPGTYMLDGKISSVEIGAPVVRPPEAQVSSFAFFYLPIRVGMAVEIGE
jgi:hypothetical protein